MTFYYSQKKCIKDIESILMKRRTSYFCRLWYREYAL